jgi:hypothetical protein
MYKFDDLVRFDSRAQGFSGKGKIVAITIDVQGNIDYWVDIGEKIQLIQGGIYEDEITMLEGKEKERRILPATASKYNLLIRSKFHLGDRVGFHVPVALGGFGSLGRTGTGTIFAITLFPDSQIEYTIAIPSREYEDLEGGVLEDQITFLED